MLLSVSWFIGPMNSILVLKLWFFHSDTCHPFSLKKCWLCCKLEIRFSKSLNRILEYENWINLEGSCSWSLYCPIRITSLFETSDVIKNFKNFLVLSALWLDDFSCLSFVIVETIVYFFSSLIVFHPFAELSWVLWNTLIWAWRFAYSTQSRTYKGC